MKLYNFTVIAYKVGQSIEVSFELDFNSIDILFKI